MYANNKWYYEVKKGLMKLFTIVKGNDLNMNT
jgi:hypothetical protein